MKNVKCVWKCVKYRDISAFLYFRFQHSTMLLLLLLHLVDLSPLVLQFSLQLSCLFWEKCEIVLEHKLKTFKHSDTTLWTDYKLMSQMWVNYLHLTFLQSRAHTSSRASTASRGRMATLSQNGPCSAPSLLKPWPWAVVARWLVPVVVATPEPNGGHRGWGDSHQAEGRVLSGLVSL